MTRATCAAVTSGTPSCNTLAVMHISATPPGAVASTRVGTGRPCEPGKQYAEGGGDDERQTDAREDRGGVARQPQAPAPG